MKKSFLSRAMSAALAVPVALSQTILCASFAVDDAAVNESALQTLTIEDFKKVPVKDTDLSPITEVEKYVKYEKSSTWNSNLQGWTNTLMGQKITLDAARLADTISSQAWYAEILKEAMSNPDYASAVAEIGLDEIIVTINVDYPYADALSDMFQKKFAEKYPDIDMDFEVGGLLSGTVILTASTEALDDFSIPFDVKFIPTGETEKDSMTIDGLFTYVENLLGNAKDQAYKAVNKKVAEYQTKLDNALAEADEKKAALDDAQADLDAAKAEGADTTDAQAKLDDANKKYDSAKQEADDAQKQLDEAQAMANGEIDSMVESYLTKIENSKKKVDKLKDSYEKTCTATDVNDLIQQAKAEAEKVAPSQSNKIDKVPDSLEEFADTNIYAQLVKIFTETLNQINEQAAIKAYEVNLDADDILGLAEEMYDITVTGAASKNAQGYGTADGTVFGYLNEDEDLDIDYYYTYFNDLFAAENKKVVDGSIKTEKVVEAAGNMVSDTMNGEVKLEIKRVITLEVEDLAETTSSSSTDSTETTVSSDSSETTVSSDSSETTVSSDSSETTVSSDSSETTVSSDSSETTVSSDSSETTVSSDSSETTTSHEGGNSSETTTSSTDPATIETTTTLPPSEVVKNYRFYADGDVESNRNFYFSHDPRPFQVSDLIQKAYVKEVTEVDGQEFIGEEELPVDLEKVSFGLTSDAADATLSPADVFKQLEKSGQEVAYTLTPLYIFYNGSVANNQVYVYIGVKGDADLNGVANAYDGAKVLVYAAAAGAGLDPSLTVESGTPNAAKEAFAFFLADIDGESRDNGVTNNIEGSESEGSVLDAYDGSKILVYAATFGAKGDDTDWVTDVLNSENLDTIVLPKFTKEIHAWEVANKTE